MIKLFSFFRESVRKWFFGIRVCLLFDNNKKLLSFKKFGFFVLSFFFRVGLGKMRWQV